MEIEVPDNGAAQIVITIVIVVVVDVQPVSIKVASVDPSARGRPNFCSLPSKLPPSIEPLQAPTIEFYSGHVVS